VWGLQRAFKKAGARSILMSLWKVNDIATSLFMEHFYKSYMNGALKQDALKDAREFVKDYKDSEGNKPFESPYYWASWIFLDAFN
jgi:CHAT domain-containing protein